MKGLFVTGIGTEVGKTVVSAILTKALKARYWKPIQSGELHDTDSMKIEKWASHPGLEIIPERYRLKQPLSPYASAKAEGVVMKLNDFSLPAGNTPLVVEGAGGLLVPLNEKDLMIDLIARLNLPVVLVSKHYLGSINHTLLSLEALQRRHIQVAGVVFNGAPLPQTEEAISLFGQAQTLFHLKHHETIDTNVVAQYAKELAGKLDHLFY